jgi:hypothetical protein
MLAIPSQTRQKLHIKRDNFFIREEEIIFREMFENHGKFYLDEIRCVGTKIW